LALTLLTSGSSGQISRSPSGEKSAAPSPAWEGPVDKRDVLPATSKVGPPVSPRSVPAGSAKAGDGKSPAQTFELGAAERISLKFKSFPELTGLYRIHSDETVSIPVVGRISVSGLDAADLERTVAVRMAEIGGKESYVSVDIEEYKPIFVIGNVSRPGAVEWRRGMTAAEAVVVSGGIVSRVPQAVDSLKRILATLARLYAEQNDMERIEIPQALVKLVGQKEARTLVDAEQPLWIVRRDALRTQISALERGRNLAGNELEALRAQMVRIEEQLKLRSEYKRKLDDLQNKGLGRVDRSFEEDMRITDLEEKRANTNVNIARVQSTLANLARDLVVVVQERKTSIYGDISRLHGEASQLRIEIEAASRMLDMDVEETGSTDSSQQVAMRTSGGDYPEGDTVFILTRRSSKVPATTKADGSTHLMPGDILRVTQAHP
jgi:polysaccharide export outer membrane protein